MGEKRIGYLDIAKGIGMICIILGHFGIGRLNSFVFTFHVPIFFLISGYLLNDRRSMAEFAARKARQLLLPYGVTCLFMIAGVASWDVFRNHTFANVVSNVKTYTIASFFGSGTIEYTEPFYVKQIGAIWFLPALFVSLLLVRWLMNYRWGGAAILAIAYVGWKTTDMFWLPMSLQAGMTASLFVYLGMIAKRYRILDRKASPAVLSLSTAVWLWCILFCGQFYMVRNYYGHGLLDILGALAGSYVVIILSQRVERLAWSARILKFFGTNSLLVLCIHAFELNVFSWSWVGRLFGEQLHFPDYGVVAVRVLCKLVFCAAGVGMIHRIVPWGKSHLPACLQRIHALCPAAQAAGSGNGRVVYWDVAKGVTILAMILGHTNLPGYLRLIIFSFHMPLFVIANGYFIKGYDVKKTLRRSAKTLLVPYSVVCLLSAVIYGWMGRPEAGFWPLFVYKIKAMIGGMSKISTHFQSFDSVWVVWFVVCLFLTRNIYVWVGQVFGKYGSHVHLFVLGVLAVIGFILGKYYAFLPWSLDVALVSLPFMAVGHWMRKENLSEKNIWYTLVLPAAVWIYFLRMGIHIEMATRSYPYTVFCMVEAIAGSMTVIAISRVLSRFRFCAAALAWVGRNSMVILGIHCLEMMYFNWNTWVYAYLPFTINWFREFVIKSVSILAVTAVIALGKQGWKTLWKMQRKA